MKTKWTYFFVYSVFNWPTTYCNKAKTNLSLGLNRFLDVWTFSEVSNGILNLLPAPWFLGVLSSRLIYKTLDFCLISSYIATQNVLISFTRHFLVLGVEWGEGGRVRGRVIGNIKTSRHINTGMHINQFTQKYIHIQTLTTITYPRQTNTTNSIHSKYKT